MQTLKEELYYMLDNNYGIVISRVLNRIKKNPELNISDLILSQAKKTLDGINEKIKNKQKSFFISRKTDIESLITFLQSNKFSNDDFACLRLIEDKKESEAIEECYQIFKRFKI